MFKDADRKGALVWKFVPPNLRWYVHACVCVCVSPLKENLRLSTQKEASEKHLHPEIHRDIERERETEIPRYMDTEREQEKQR